MAKLTLKVNRPTEEHIKKAVEQGNKVRIKQELQPYEVVTNQFSEVFEYFGDPVKKK